mgnify:CR=1 FL=1|tara:strand:+ start:151 stop:684 length:534 start_codon:yes stop_codon:yes gene_type:complete
MRHKKHRGKLGRTPSHRKALLKNLTHALIEEERIVTTLAKAKAVRPFAEKLITLAKEKDLHRIRLVSDRLRLSKSFRPAEPPKFDSEDLDEDQKKVVFEPVTQRRDIRNVKKLFNVIGPRFKDRPGGYTRILRLSGRPSGKTGLMDNNDKHLVPSGFRMGDSAQMVVFELVERSSSE